MKYFWFILALLGLFGESALAEERAESAIPENLQVIEGLEFDYGARSVIMNRVVPPVRPEKAPQPAAPELAQSLLPTSANEIQTEAKENVFVWGTSYAGRVSEIHWTRDGRQYEFLSTIPFHELPGFFTEIAHGNHEFTLMVMVSDVPGETGYDVASQRIKSGKWPVEVQPWLEEDAKSAQYLVNSAPEDAANNAEALELMDALHLWFDSNKVQIEEDHAAREARRELEEQQRQANPPQPKDTVINFWPKKSTNYSVNSQ